MTSGFMTAFITVDIDGDVEERSFRATPVGMAALFANYVYSASQSTSPQKVRLAVSIPVYSQADRTCLSRENSMIYWNTAYIQLHPEEEAYV